MIRLNQGSIFSIKCDLLVIPCDYLGGVSSQISRGLNDNGIPKFARKMEAGEVFFLEGPFSAASAVAYAASVDVNSEKQNVNIIEKIMNRIRGYCTLKGIRTVNMPLLGTGAGNLDPASSFKIILANMMDASFVVNVFALSKQVYDFLAQQDLPTEKASRNNQALYANNDVDISATLSKNNQVMRK